MKKVVVQVSLWSKYSDSARKSKNGTPLIGDIAEPVAAEILGGTWCHDWQTPGADVVLDGRKVEIKAPIKNPANFGGKEVGKASTPEEAAKTYTAHTGAELYGVFTDFNTLLVMTPEEFTAWAIPRLVLKRGSGNKGMNWKLKKNPVKG